MYGKELAKPTRVLFGCKCYLQYPSTMFEVLIIVVLWLLTTTGVLPPWLTLILMIPLLPGLFAMLGAAPYVPTSRKIQSAMMTFAKVKPGEKVYDVGSGDGRLVFAAAEAGADAVGYEYSLPTYLYSIVRWIVRNPKKRGKIYFADFWKKDYRDADVVLCFLTIKTMQKFFDVIWPQLKPGCRVVSHAFKMKQVPIAESGGEAVLYIKS
jgi:SAM-dependent methyltransferase